ncbi:MAG: phage holin family protein [Polyangiaceae bacterium]|nr:phage holin family protein [Polyangiaceae bacterium]NUQ78092.1 phage holin family protein [Polyangiaceae bacterium]
MAETQQNHETGLVDLVKGAVKDAQELVKIEVDLAKNEAKEEVTKLTASTIAFAAAFALAILTISMLLVAAVFAVGGGAVPALAIAAVLFLITAGAAIAGYMLIPKEAPLDDTKEHAERQVNVLKERMAS